MSHDSRIVEVEWIDAHVDFKDHEGDASKVLPSNRYSVGYVHEENDEFIRIAESLSDGDGESRTYTKSGAYFTAIPKCMIRSIREWS